MAVVTDTIADMLTRIRNANSMRYTEVKVPASKLKLELARILKEEGFIKDYKVLDENVQGMILITLKYGEKKERVITGLKRISKPGLRVYAKADEVPKVLNGLGIALICSFIFDILALTCFLNISTSSSPKSFSIKLPYFSPSSKFISTLRSLLMAFSSIFLIGLYPAFSISPQYMPTPLFCHKGNLSKLTPLEKSNSFL